MGKRTKPIVVVSSSDEDDVLQHKHKLNSKSSLQTSSSVPPRLKRSKKAPRLSTSCSKSRIDSNPFDQVLHSTPACNCNCFI